MIHGFQKELQDALNETRDAEVKARLTDILLEPSGGSLISEVSNPK
jgi:hypothetical protein